MSDAARRDWISRVLGVDVGIDAGGDAAGPPLLPIWTAAKDRVDTGIGRLQAALLAADDDDLAQIAEYGLYGATQGQAVKLMAALRDADAAPSPSTHRVLLAAVDNYRDFLDGAPIVDLIEDNPFGVSVKLRDTLGSALDEVERRLAA